MTDPRERVLVVTTSYPEDRGDAAGHFVEAEVDALRRAGHQVTVIAAGRTSLPGTHSLGAAGIFSFPGALSQLRRSPGKARQLVHANRSLLRFSKSHRSFDRLICHWLLPSGFPWGLYVAREALHKEVVVHGSDLEVFLKLPAGLRARILRTLKRRGFALRFVSQRLRARLESKTEPPDLWAYVGGARIAPPPLDVSTAPERPEARRRLGIRSDERWAVFVGRLIETKRPQTALAAAELVPELHLAIVGGGPLEAELRRAYPQFRFLGQVPRDVALTWIAAADVLLAPSRNEGAPTAIREARALGTSVVSAPSGDTEEWARLDPDLWIV